MRCCYTGFLHVQDPKEICQHFYAQVCVQKVTPRSTRRPGVHSEIPHHSSPRFASLSDDTLFGYKLPFNVATCRPMISFNIFIILLVPSIFLPSFMLIILFPFPFILSQLDATLVLLSTQFTVVLTFFLSRNLRIARERAWNQTVASRGKGPDFWGPYVEELDVPPEVDVGRWAGPVGGAKGWVVRNIVKQGESSYVPICWNLNVRCGVYLAALFCITKLITKLNSNPLIPPH